MGPLRRLFADRARLWVVPVLVVLLVLDVGLWMGFNARTSPRFVQCLESEAAVQPCLGEDVVLPLQIVHAIEGPDRFRVGRIDGSVLVIASAEGLRVGQEVTVGGLRTEQGLVARFVQTHPGRPWKRRLGLIGSLFLVILVPLSLTVSRTPQGWRVVPRGWVAGADG